MAGHRSKGPQLKTPPHFRSLLEKPGFGYLGVAVVDGQRPQDSDILQQARIDLAGIFASRV